MCSHKNTQSEKWGYFLLFIYLYCIISAASLLPVLPVFDFLLNLPYTVFIYFFVSHLLSEVLGADGQALGTTYTKGPHTNTIHTPTYTLMY